MAGKRKLKMTKKCIAARRCYRARKAGVPARRKRGGNLGSKYRSYFKPYTKIRARKRPDPNIAKRVNAAKRVIQQAAAKRVNKGAGLRRKRKGRGRGRGRRRGRGRGRGAGFLQDLGKSFEWVGNAALTALPFVAAVL